MIETVMQYMNVNLDDKTVLYDTDSDKVWIINEDQEQITILDGSKDGYMDMLELVSVDYKILNYVNTELLKLLEEDVDYMRDNGGTLEMLLNDLLEYGVKVEE